MPAPPNENMKLLASPYNVEFSRRTMKISVFTSMMYCPLTLYGMNATGLV